MKQIVIHAALMFLATKMFSQSRFPENQISINGFRNPSIGLEYHRHQISFHAGYYITALKSGITTKFVKIGVSAWFLPLGKKEQPSSFYASLSYLRGLNLDYKNENALGFETGFRWMIWKGLNLRMGAIALMADGHSVKINPTPGLSYSLLLK